jgi:hypothetical protein
MDVRSSRCIVSAVKRHFRQRRGKVGTNPTPFFRFVGDAIVPSALIALLEGIEPWPRRSECGIGGADWRPHRVRRTAHVASCQGSLAWPKSSSNSGHESSGGALLIFVHPAAENVDSFLLAFLDQAFEAGDGIGLDHLTRAERVVEVGQRDLRKSRHRVEIDRGGASTGRAGFIGISGNVPDPSSDIRPSVGA